MGRKNCGQHYGGIGEMTKFIIVVFLVLSAFIVFTIPYKHRYKRKLSKKKHKLWGLYGVGMFIVDRLPKKIFQNTGVNNDLKKITVKEHIIKEQYFYYVEKVCIVVGVIWLTLVVSIAVLYSESKTDRQISKVERSVKSSNNYNVRIIDDVGEETVKLNVAKKQYTESEKQKVLEKNKKVLLKEVLGKNKSQNKVNSKLNLVSEIGKEKVNVYWKISDKNIINYNGEISSNVKKQGEVVTLTATMTFKKKTIDYSFGVNVYPSSDKSSKGNYVQEYVDENDKYSNQVKLPQQINGKKVTYRETKDTVGKYIPIIGIIVGITLFFLKDKDLKKEVEKRNRQLLNDYPEIVSKILLYYGAGLSIKSAIERMVAEYNVEKKKNSKAFRYAFEELSMCSVKMKSGVPETVAISEYGNRCNIHCYIKLAGLIEQNLKRGTKELTLVLKSELKDAMNERKNNLLKNGGQVSTKLLGPMVLMLIITIAIIMVPALLSINI